MRETIKFNKWVSCFNDKADKSCFGNATQSAIKAYGYNPKTQYNLASVTGSKNIRKYKVLGMVVAEEMGVGFREFIKIGINKAINGNYDDWERFGIQIGYLDKK